MFWNIIADVVFTRGLFAGFRSTRDGGVGIRVASMSPENIANERNIFQFHSSISAPFPSWPSRKPRLRNEQFSATQIHLFHYIDCCARTLLELALRKTQTRKARCKRVACIFSAVTSRCMSFCIAKPLLCMIWRREYRLAGSSHNVLRV